MTKQALEMKNNFIKANLGKEHEVIIENEKNGYYLAHTKNFILCYIKSDKPLKPNTYKNVELLSLFEDGATARLV